MPQMLWTPPSVTAVALTLYVLGLLAAFGARSWLHRRRTGDTGLRAAAPPHPWGRVGAILFMGSLLIALGGLSLTLVLPHWRWELSESVSWAGLLVAVLGLAATLSAQTAMGPSWRIGVDPEEATDLITHGPFAVVRNPIFTAMGIMLTGLTLMVPGLPMLLALLTFCVGAQLQVRLVEEPALLARHGTAYRAYTARVGRFLPGVGKRAEEWA